MELHSINTDAQLYVMKSGNGFSCYGFDVMDRKARAVAAWLESVGFDPGSPGNVEHFAACADAIAKGAAHAAKTGNRCPAELVPELIGLEGRRVEATVYGERVRFNVGKSTGWLPLHLQLHNRASRGGGALSAGAVSNVRVIY